MPNTPCNIALQYKQKTIESGQASALEHFSLKQAAVDTYEMAHTGH